MFTLFTRRFLIYLMLGLAALMATLPLATPAAADWRSLTGLLPAHVDIDQVEISPDSRYIVFTADIEVDEQPELYSVPITGTMPLKLNPLLVAGGQVYGLNITPDSQYVIYTAKQEAGNSSNDLYRVPITGGQAVKLNVGPMAGRNVGRFEIDPDNVHVVYHANQQSNDISELFSVPIAGGSGAKLNPPLVTGGDVYSAFEIDPISNRVVYLADQEVDNREELYGVPIAGGTAVKLNPPGSRVFSFALNPQIQVVVFRSRFGFGSSELYMNATTGGLLTPLSYPLASNESVKGFRISPDGAQVVYNVVVSTPTTPDPYRGNLYSVLIGGGDSTLLTTSADPGYGVVADLFEITADGQRVVYLYQKNSAAPQMFESVALNSGNRAALSSPATGTPSSFYDTQVSPNGQWVIFRVSRVLYSIPTTGGTAVPLEEGYFQGIMPDSSRVLFTSSQLPETNDLFSREISGGGLRNLSRLSSGFEAWGASPSPDARWVVFRVSHPTDQIELRVSDGAEGQPPTPTPPPAPPTTSYRVYLPLIVR